MGQMLTGGGMSIDFRADLEGILIEGIATVRPMPTVCAATAAGERIQLRVSGGMRSPVGIFAGAADRVSSAGWHV
jgi:hypothetical protein